VFVIEILVAKFINYKNCAKVYILLFLISSMRLAAVIQLKGEELTLDQLVLESLTYAISYIHLKQSDGEDHQYINRWENYLKEDPRDTQQLVDPVYFKIRDYANSAINDYISTSNRRSGVGFVGLGFSAAGFMVDANPVIPSIVGAVSLVHMGLSYVNRIAVKEVEKFKDRAKELLPDSIERVSPNVEMGLEILSGQGFY
jgi:hypothetical protein